MPGAGAGVQRRPRPARATADAGGTIRSMPDREPGDRPPRRLLEHAPSERYAATRTGGPGDDQPVGGPARDRGGPGRGGESRGLRRAFLLGLVAAALGAAVHVAFAVLLLVTGGLLVVAATLGFVVGAVVRYGAGSRVRAGAVRGLGLALALAGIVAALTINWSLSGEYLGPLDFLAQVYGALVPLQLAAAGAGALAGTR
jgi:hypothetical protein